MKHKLFYITGLCALLILFISAVQSGAFSGPGMGAATPVWDRTIPCTSKYNCQRFVVLTNMGSHAVLDKETGLVWEQSPNVGTYDWYSAHFNCMQYFTGGRSGWRLPTIQELSTLIDPTQSNPALPPGHPFSFVQSSFYWSATTTAADTSHAWGVNFQSGGSSSVNKSSDYYFWCVRGGQGVDLQ